MVPKGLLFRGVERFEGFEVAFVISIADIQAQNVNSHNEEGNDITSDHVGGSIGCGFHFLFSGSNRDFELEFFDLFLQPAEADAVPEQVDEDDGEGKESE